jgi:hypothetical protein
MFRYCSIKVFCFFITLTDLKAVIIVEDVLKCWMRRYRMRMSASEEASRE